VLLHGACYSVSGIVPLCMALSNRMGRRMRPFNAKRLLCSGKYKRTPCILYSSLSSTLQMHKGVGIAPVIGRQDCPRERAFPQPDTPRLQNVRTLRSPTFSPSGTPKWPISETDREVTNVWSSNCWRYFNRVTQNKRQRVTILPRLPLSVRLY
jgi:hypothetical protein